MTTREKLHRLVDEFSEDEAEAALARLVREREAIEHWAQTADTEADEEAWARENAREAVREALITRTIRGIDTEVELGPDDGMPVACAISLDNLRTVPRALLTERITGLSEAKMDAVCRALARSAGC